MNVKQLARTENQMSPLVRLLPSSHGQFVPFLFSHVLACLSYPAYPSLAASAFPSACQFPFFPSFPSYLSCSYLCHSSYPSSCQLSSFSCPQLHMQVQTMQVLNIFCSVPNRCAKIVFRFLQLPFEHFEHLNQFPPWTLTKKIDNSTCWTDMGHWTNCWKKHRWPKKRTCCLHRHCWNCGVSSFSLSSFSLICVPRHWHLCPHNWTALRSLYLNALQLLLSPSKGTAASPAGECTFAHINMKVELGSSRGKCC